MPSIPAYCGPCFVVVVAGDHRLHGDHYPTVAGALDHLLCRWLPNVKILHEPPADNGAARLAQRYGRERRLLLWELRPGQFDTLTAAGLDGGIVFDAGGAAEADVARRVREMGLRVRTIGVGSLIAAG
jgi:hypothetical protein